MREPLRFLSVCSGLEGASLAVEPLGWTPVGFSEIETFPSAIIAERYGSNMPDEPLSRNAPPNFGDFTKIPLDDLGSVDILIGGTPCFTAGHLVLTESGYRPIDGIRPGDLIMTHKGRLRRVLAAGSKQAHVGRLEGVGIGEDVVCTPDHPFLSVAWSNQNTKRDNKYVRIEHCGDPVWAAAKDMPGRQWCALSVYELTQEPPLSCRFTNEQAMYIAGLYVGDGHIRGWSGKGKKAVVLSLNPAKYEKMIAVIGAGSHTRSDERTSIRATICDTAFAEWLDENFGHLSYLKNVPAWVLGHEHRAAFLRGFLDADGNRKGDMVGVSTTSRALAYGVAALLDAEGYASSVAFVSTPDTCIIEGRTVNQRDYWQVRAYDLASSRKARNRHGYILRKATAFEPIGVDAVYNIEVEEDHSFIVNGAIVHNCQAFSVAGKRMSLDDARGNLTLAYVVLAHELARSHGLRNAIWENVPGVLNTKDNAFGCFLGALVGHDTAFPQPRGAGWPCAGMVDGPRGRAAWRVLDAQFFGLAQRRERVFVVADFGDGADPVQVLFERKGLQGHSAPRREKGERTTGTLAARTRGGGGLGTDFHCDGGLVAFGGGNLTGPIEQATTLTAGVHYDFEVETFIAHSLRAEGFDASEDGTGRGTPIVPVVHGAFNWQSGGDCRRLDLAPVVQPLTKGQTPAIAFQANAGSQGGDVYEELCPTLRVQKSGAAGMPAIAFSCKDNGADASVDLSPTLRAGGFTTSHANAGVMPAIAFQTHGSNIEAGGDVSGTIQTNSDRASGSAPMVAQAFDLRGREGGAQFEGPHDTANIRAASGGSSRSYVAQQLAVRRLTPTECERLQGVPDGHTKIAWRGKPADECPDGPRYKALGNSWAIPVVHWIASRVDAALKEATP